MKDFKKWMGELKELLKVATPGEWWVGSHGHGCHVPADGKMIFQVQQVRESVRHADTGNLSGWSNDNDASYIPTACPDNIAELVQRYERAIELLKTVTGLETEGSMSVSHRGNGETLVLKVVDGEIVVVDDDPDEVLKQMAGK